MIGQWAGCVNDLVAAISQVQGGKPDVSGSLNVVTIIAVSALAILAPQDLILAVVHRLADLLRSMSHIVIDARRDGVYIDLEAGEASDVVTPRGAVDGPDDAEGNVNDPTTTRTTIP